MPVTFQSQATGQLVMLQAHAEALLQLLGKTAKAPGILEVADMAHALSVLRSLPATTAGEPPAEPRDEAAPDEADRPHGRPEPAFADEPVSLRQRAAPFVRLIEQAQAGNKPIVWGV
jgi:hypothetical protein